MKVDIKGDRLFPFQFQFIGLIIFLAGAVVIVQNIYIGFVLLFIALAIFTGRSGVEIDPEVKKYREYYTLLFVKFGKWSFYKMADYIYITASLYSQKIYTAHTMQSSTFRNVEYNAYLKLDEKIKLYLGHSKKKEKIVSRLVPFVSKLFVPLHDVTEEH